MAVGKLLNLSVASSVFLSAKGEDIAPAGLCEEGMLLTGVHTVAPGQSPSSCPSLPLCLAQWLDGEWWKLLEKVGRKKERYYD